MKHKAQDKRKREQEPSSTARDKSRREARRAAYRFKHGEGR